MRFTAIFTSLVASSAVTVSATRYAPAAVAVHTPVTIKRSICLDGGSSCGAQRLADATVASINACKSDLTDALNAYSLPDTSLPSTESNPFDRLNSTLTLVRAGNSAILGAYQGLTTGLSTMVNLDQRAPLLQFVVQWVPGFEQDIYRLVELLLLLPGTTYDFRYETITSAFEIEVLAVNSTTKILADLLTGLDSL